MGNLGITLNALLLSLLYTPLQLLCKGRLNELLFLDILKDLKFILHAQCSRCAFATRCARGSNRAQIAWPGCIVHFHGSIK